VLPRRASRARVSALDARARDDDANDWRPRPVERSSRWIHRFECMITLSHDSSMRGWVHTTHVRGYTQSGPLYDGSPARDDAVAIPRARRHTPPRRAPVRAERRAENAHHIAFAHTHARRARVTTSHRRRIRAHSKPCSDTRVRIHQIRARRIVVKSRGFVGDATDIARDGAHER